MLHDVHYSDRSRIQLYIRSLKKLVCGTQFTKKLVDDDLLTVPTDRRLMASGRRPDCRGSHFIYCLPLATHFRLKFDNRSFIFNRTNIVTFPLSRFSINFTTSDCDCPDNIIYHFKLDLEDNVVIENYKEDNVWNEDEIVSDNQSFENDGKFSPRHHIYHLSINQTNFNIIFFSLFLFK